MITIVDYKAGNPTSVQRALGAVGIESRISPDPAQVRGAERIIDVDLGEAGQSPREVRIIFLFFGVKADIFQHHDIAGLHGLSQVFHLFANTIRRQLHRLV